jgi:transcriptional regulator with XRE-family HTH domain
MNSFNHDFVRAELKRLSKTQEDLAREVGVGASTMNRWLRGKHNPLMIFQRKITEVMNGWERESQSATG